MMRRIGSTAGGHGYLAAVLAAALAAPASATTTTLGDVAVGEPSPDDITVGFANGSNDFAFGLLRIDGGTAETFDRLVVGNQELAIGEVTVAGVDPVTGAPSTLTLTDGGLAFGQALLVAEEGTGSVTVSGGAVLNVSSTANGTLEIGEQVGSFGRVTVEGRSPAGFPTRLIVAENTIVGGDGIGELTIRGGALVNHVDQEGATLVIGEEANGFGLVTLTGETTFWQAPELISIGVVGSGELRVTGGATFDADNGLLDPGQTTTIGPRGFVNLSGGRFFTEATTVDGRLGGWGTASGAITVSLAGQVSTTPGQKLRLLGPVTNAGLINVTGTPEQRSELELFGTLTNAGAVAPAVPGRIAVSDGVLRLNSPLVNDGVLSSAGGDTDFHGDITNSASGVVVIGGQSNATFFDDVTVAGGTFTLSAGSTALFLGDLTISAGVAFSIAVDGSSTESGFETPLQVAGLTTLDSPIELILQNGFVPDEGDTIPLLAASGGLAINAIDTNAFAPLPGGLDWELVLTDTGVAVQVVSGDGGITPNTTTIGDFNADGIVNPADYAVWRDTVGPGAGGPTDADGSGTVDNDDLAIWQRSYGGGSSLGVNAGVPEPSSALLLLAATAVAIALRR